MRQFYIRLIIGLVWIVASGVSLFNNSLATALMYFVLGIIFIFFAGAAWKKAKGNKRDE